MKPTVLLTLGRLPPAVDIARSLHATGWRVLVAEPFSTHLARTSRAVARSFRVPAPVDDAHAYRDALLDIVSAEHVTLIVPVSEETLHVSALHDSLPDTVTLFSLPQNGLLSLHSKLRFVEAASAAGLSVPETAASGDAAANELMQRYDTIMKPEFSCSGRGISMHAAGERVPPSQDRMLIQERIDGDEYSAFAICADGRLQTHCTYRALVRHGSVAVAFERIEHAGVADWVERFVATQRHTGFIAFDLIVDERGTAYGIECNPRATSGLHFVNNADIARLVTDPRASGALRDETRLQEFWSCWTQFLSVVGDRQARSDTWHAMRSARDVTWQWSDPWVFLLATLSTWPIISKSIRRRETFAEVLALDIEWLPDDV